MGRVIVSGFFVVIWNGSREMKDFIFVVWDDGAVSRNSQNEAL